MLKAARSWCLLLFEGYWELARQGSFGALMTSASVGTVTMGTLLCFPYSPHDGSGRHPARSSCCDVRKLCLFFHSYCLLSTSIYYQLRIELKCTRNDVQTSSFPTSSTRRSLESSGLQAPILSSLDIACSLVSLRIYPVQEDRCMCTEEPVDPNALDSLNSKVPHLAAQLHLLREIFDRGQRNLPFWC